MDPLRNLELRQKWLIKCDEDPVTREYVMAACKRSFMLWCSMFVLTYVVQEVDEGGRRVPRKGSADVPFLLWPCQAAAVEEMMRAKAAGESVCVPKARDMGATWLVLAWFVWCAGFHAETLLVASRKEDMVDDPGNPDGLFQKIDHILLNLPGWMFGPCHRVRMHVSIAGGAIDGESTNDGLSVGGRKHAILLDEAARMQGLQAIDAGTQHSTPCRVFVSTIQPGAYFSELCRSNRVRVVSLGWWNHPQKGRGRRLIKDERTGGLKWTSPYYEHESAKATPKQIATELDMDHEGGGQTVFPLAMIQMHKDLYGRAPIYVGEVSFFGGDPDPLLLPHNWPHDTLRFVDMDAGRLILWCELELWEGVRYRPSQDRDYCFGIDISDGVGTTPSVISIGDVDGRRKIGRWLCRHTQPETLARVVFMLAHWFGGRRKYPLIVPETNGGRGKTLVGHLAAWGYQRLYQHRDATHRSANDNPTYGWHSHRFERAAQIERYVGRLRSGAFINPDVVALDEARRWMYTTDGSVGLPEYAEETDEVVASHGDITIADMLCDLGISRAPQQKLEAPVVPAHTLAGLIAKRKRETQERWGLLSRFIPKDSPRTGLRE